VGRPAVRTAVISALNQTTPPLEVIVVVDSGDQSAPAVLGDISEEIRLLYTEGIGPSGARMQGAIEARGEVIAFLDDDDVWLPSKLERQLASLPNRLALESHFLVSCRIVVISKQGQMLRTLPTRIFDEREQIATYLFRRSTLAYGEGLLHPSTLMCDRALIRVEPWDSTVTRHEDWDWLLRVGKRTDVTINMCPDVLVEVAMAGRSISGRWRMSLEWLQHRADLLSPRERGDFLLCYTATSAIRSRSRRGGVIAAWDALRCGRPGLKAWLVWSLHMLSPTMVDYGTRLKSRLSRSSLTIELNERSDPRTDYTRFDRPIHK
jgi:glycosyltransferase involved in cell wall biosynthesis